MERKGVAEANESYHTGEVYTCLFSFVPSRFIKLTDSFGAEKERGRERTCACNAGGDYGTQNSTQNAAAQSIEYTGPAGLIECILPMPDYIPAAPPNQLHSRPRDQSAAAPCRPCFSSSPGTREVVPPSGRADTTAGKKEGGGRWQRRSRQR